jgi:soluble lytic murein transglycosylase-like protein
VRGAVERAVPAKRRLAFIHFMGAQIEDFQRGWGLVTGRRFDAMTDQPDPADVRWLLAYPRAWAPLVERLAADYRLPAAFVWGIMRHESAYRPSAVSHKDAVGALQMIRPTARRVAAELGLTFDPWTFARPELGFVYGVHYLAKHRDTFRGQLIAAAAAYNAGPQPVAHWLRESQGAPPAELVEEFVYGEARAYARRVAEHTLRYLYLYEPDAARRGAVLDALYPVAVDYRLPADVGY